MFSLRLFSKRKIVRNFSILTLANAGTQLLTLFVTIKIARYLKPVAFGSFNLLQLHISIITVITSLGLRNIIIRDIARDKSSIVKACSSSLIIRMPAFALVMGLFSAYYYYSKQYDLLLFLLVGLSILGAIFFDLFESIAFGLEKMQMSGLLNLASVAGWLASILLLPSKKINLEYIFSLFVFFSLGKTSLYYFLLRKQKLVGLIRAVGPKREVVSFLKESFPFYYISLFTLLSNQIPLIFLQYRAGVEEIGYFNIANKILMPINLVVFTALATLYPNLSRLYANDFKKFIEKTRIVFIVLAMFLMTTAFTFTIFSQEIINILYSKKYFQSSSSLKYQSWYLSVYLLVCFIGTILGAINRQKELGYLSVICTIIQVPILWFGSKGGAESLSIAFFIATIISLIFHMLVISKFLNYKISFLFFFRVKGFLVAGFLLSSFVPLESNVIIRALIVGAFLMTVLFVFYKAYAAQSKVPLRRSFLTP